MVKAYVCKAAEWVTRESSDPRRLWFRRGIYRQQALCGCTSSSIFEGADETLCLKLIARRLLAEAE